MPEDPIDTRRRDLRALLLRACPEPAKGRKSIRQFSRLMGRSQQTVYKHWLAKARIPVDAVEPLLELANGRVTRTEVLPFVFNRD